MNQIQLRTQDLKDGTLHLVELQDGQIVAEDSEGVHYEIEVDGWES